MDQKTLAFMKEYGIAVFVEADRTTGAVHIEKQGDLESWDLFQQLVRYSDVETLCDSTRSPFPFQVWGQGDTGCLLSWLDGGRAVALFFDSELSGPAFTKWVSELDQKVRGLYPFLMEPLPSCGRMYTIDKKADAAEIKMRYQYSTRVLQTCADDPDKIKEAAEILKELAEGGYAEAQCSLGAYYSQGWYVEPDQAKAAYWYEEATKRGSLKAAEALAGLYCCNAPDGMSPEQASELALKWHKRWFSMLEAKAEKGGIKEAEALMNGYMYQPPADMEGEQATVLARKWYETWIALLKATAEKGSIRAKKKLADVLYSGDGVPEELLSEFSDEEDDRSLKQSVELYEQLAAQGDAEAFFSLGCAYDYFEAPEEDLKKSFTYFMKAAQMGYAQAYTCLGSAYFRGKGVEKDWTKAREMYQTGAAMGNPFAMLQFANCLKQGTGGEKDYPAARRLYLQLAKHRNDDALYELGDMYLKGLGAEADLQKAFDCFTKAAKHGNRAAENALNSKKFRDFKR